MHEIKITFLAVLLAHVLGDFVFSDRAYGGSEEKAKRYVEHGLIHFGLLLMGLTLAGRQILSWHIQLLLIAYIAVHLLLDFVKHVLIRQNMVPDSALLFVMDESLHITIISLLAFLIGDSQWRQLLGQINWSIESRERALIVAVVYTSTIFAGGYLIRYLTRSLELQPQPGSDETVQELRNAGMYIGWLERFLVISAVFMQSPALVGLILTGKSIARFPELKQARFSEYFLIGTSLSVSLALVAGLILLHFFYGTISLK